MKVRTGLLKATMVAFPLALVAACDQGQEQETGTTEEGMTQPAPSGAPEEPMGGAMEETGEEAGQAMDEMGGAMEEAGEKAKEDMGEAMDTMEEKSEEAMDTMEEESEEAMDEMNQ